MILAILGIIIGVVIGIYLPITYSPSYSLYVSVAILACMDSVFGGLRALMENKFNTSILVSGFFGNSILAAFLAYVGDRLGVPLYYAAIFAFGGRLFQNFAIIRRYVFRKRSNKN
ncbi:hypothetical protein DUF1290 [Gottschalkia acidurici 9a]|uniref:Small basic protein n=1 Tax=Gottschalkia acidurici (strain ATCC 7906 / DSM 604 / BCRC 14475 / CIP 104303 / KCTC 5404 / NCIMB 10678 / 9a) TaxID=1128398 RepID=K0AZV5_GOTA9|nr:small basic family protein [Gottschalkia acidurici]AFS78317.1 hypothetical protein DUF1290 [Gottschalkia acidurici 9a]